MVIDNHCHILGGIGRVRAEGRGITSQEMCGFRRKRTTCITSLTKKKDERKKGSADAERKQGGD